MTEVWGGKVVGTSRYVCGDTLGKCGNTSRYMWGLLIYVET